MVAAGAGAAGAETGAELGWPGMHSSVRRRAVGMRHCQSATGAVAQGGVGMVVLVIWPFFYELYVSDEFEFSTGVSGELTVGE